MHLCRIWSLPDFQNKYLLSFKINKILIQFISSKYLKTSKQSKKTPLVITCFANYWKYRMVIVPFFSVPLQQRLPRQKLFQEPQSCQTSTETPIYQAENSANWGSLQLKDNCDVEKNNPAKKDRKSILQWQESSSAPGFPPEHCNPMNQKDVPQRQSLHCTKPAAYGSM